MFLTIKGLSLLETGHQMNNSLLNLTNAYLAIEGLLQSRILSQETREKLEDVLKILDQESERELQKADKGKGKSSAA